MIERYSRQLALPEMSITQQQKLAETKILYVGAGGLGSAALPYLAAAGIGHITVIDHDVVSISNLHRQTIYKDKNAGQSKAELCAQYLKELNPEIEVEAIAEKFTPDFECHDFDLLIDGTDNFETKTALNTASIKHHIPLITASVNQFAGQCGIFAGFSKHYPCYHCLFPELPSDARNCNDAGILGTSAGLTGMYQAHMALCYVLGIGEATMPGDFLSFDFKAMRTQKLTCVKDGACIHCHTEQDNWVKEKTENVMSQLLTWNDLKDQDHIVVDVRTDDEITTDPLPMPSLHMEVSTVQERYKELPSDKTVAFVCAGNVRSVQAAEYVTALGYDNAVILDKFSF